MPAFLPDELMIFRYIIMNYVPIVLNDLPSSLSGMGMGRGEARKDESHCQPQLYFALTAES